jgi:hypothetical protein
MLRAFWLVLLVACQAKQPMTPSYFHKKPPGPKTYASCQDIVTCYTRCNPVTEQCMQSCDAYTTLDVVRDARDLTSCLQDSRCNNEGCTRERCGTQIDKCTNERREEGKPQNPY